MPGGGKLRGQLHSWKHFHYYCYSVSYLIQTFMIKFSIISVGIKKDCKIKDCIKQACWIKWHKSLSHDIPFENKIVAEYGFASLIQD